MTPEQIKHLVDRFLSWKLPENFRPDAGISFKPEFNEHTERPMRHEPRGTNLFDAKQAEEMVRYMFCDLPGGLDPLFIDLRERIDEVVEFNGRGFWRTCSGCYESEDGYPNGHYPHSRVLQCTLGGGCSECGGLGATWDDIDYDEMARDMLAEDEDEEPGPPSW